jgi:hypothetical protein
VGGRDGGGGRPAGAPREAGRRSHGARGRERVGAATGLACSEAERGGGDTRQGEALRRGLPATAGGRP